MNRSSIITPCFILHEDEFVRNIKNFYEKLGKCFYESVVGYSFKTNSLPRLLQLAKDNGCWAEVVSDDEYCLAEEIGYPKDKIIFNGPVKGKECFIKAIQGKSMINIDSKREIQWLEELKFEEQIDIGIRVNFDLENQLPGSTTTGDIGGRFGFCYENGELHKVIRRLSSIENVRISGLHMHVSNALKTAEVYQKLAAMVCKIVKEEILDLKYVDFGGGYFGGGDNGEYYEKYVQMFKQVLDAEQLGKLKIIVEPGASVVATAFTYLTSVLDKKVTEYGKFVVTDGTRLHIDPFMKKTLHHYKVVTNSDVLEKTQVICGYTCMEKDRFMTINDTHELSEGDQIEYCFVGSYTMCFNSLFISYLPRVYAKKEEAYILVRDKWSVKEYLQKNRWSE